MARLKNLLLRLAFPPRCAACGKLLTPVFEGKQPVLCKACSADFSHELFSQCSRCFMPYHSCRCVLPNMEKHGIVSHVKLSSYRTDAGKQSFAVRNIVFYLKRHNDREAFAFLAKELTPGVRDAIAELEERHRERGEAIPPQTLVCHLPRTVRQRRRYGFDQARELAEALARELGLSYLPILRRRRDGLPQKSLSARERATNLKGAFERAHSTANARVILVDDVVTTGAGMAEAASLLEAAEILAVSVAFTEKKTENHL